ncbi:ABC transporter ATP-binding protein [Telmatospirillum siberiense]|nr:ATP-binding cassette domain-containing protein [Telmatospirillum siberiense]
MSVVGNAKRLSLSLHAKHWPDGRQVLGAMNFSLAVGEVLAISGPSGCGKSTLLSIVAGLDQAFDGRLEWSGGQPPGLGIVFQTPRLLPWRTVLANVSLGLADGAKNTSPARQALAEVGLSEAADVYPARLSLGMARRVAFARALLSEPDLLLLDEAFASLDDEAAGKLRASVMTRVANRRMSVLMVTHDLRDAEEMADRLLVLGGTPARVVDERAMPTRTSAPTLTSTAVPTDRSFARGSCPP